MPTRRIDSILNDCDDHRRFLSQSIFHISFSFSIIFVFAINQIDALHLTGVTLVPNHPRSDVYQSFFHELMAEIGDVGQFSYQLRILPEAIYGGEIGETRPQGLIGEIYENNVDFILADMEITPERSKLIQFTRPFMSSKLAALVQRINHSESLDFREVLQKNKRAVIKGSLVERYFKTSKNPLVYHLLPDSVPDIAKGIEMVKSKNNFALISDSARLELIANNDCNLQVIQAKTDSSDEFGSDFKADYAIGVSKDSPFFGYFENSLKFLDETGRLEAVIDQHWFDQCEQQFMESRHHQQQQQQQLENKEQSEEHRHKHLHHSKPKLDQTNSAIKSSRHFAAIRLALLQQFLIVSSVILIQHIPLF
ncbi:Glutamate receptor ionotropic, kainate 4 [Sarcoptes scabiei]|uniref:Glutamate receptor ionotropic, kainate 4 n=1 Tax=Sarcoptes scabiei TaxID=52283 RepID=A0A834R627_SARSC|nr:Glutamate receptor ionotropic, kainate 4 [Sarcoptes scabiei]